MPTLKRMVAPLVLVTALACTGPVLAADPTPHQIYEVFRAGHLEQAQQMINQVLRDHPDSAQAHYIDAQIAARMANFPQARAELAKAQQLDPSGSFAKPDALAALQRELAHSNAYAQGYRTAPYVRQQHQSSFGYWPIILLVIAGVVIGWALLSRRNPPQYGGYPQYPGGVPPAGGPGGGYGVPPGYGPAGYGPPMGGGGMGSGIVGGLASGLAIGAGVAAGEALVHHWIDGNGNRVEGPPPAGYVPPPQDDNPYSGGNDFGVSDSNSWDNGGGGGDFGSSDGGGGDWT